MIHPGDGTYVCVCPALDAEKPRRLCVVLQPVNAVGKLPDNHES
jgi:hypothetical protein